METADGIAQFAGFARRGPGADGWAPSRSAGAGCEAGALGAAFDMLFFVRFDVTQPANVSNQDLVETWRREAEAAIGAIDAGAVPHLWKVAGQRVVLAVVDLPTAEDLDGALGSLPIIREMGAGVKTEAWPIYDYRSFAAALNDGTHGG